RRQVIGIDVGGFVVLAGPLVKIYGLRGLVSVAKDRSNVVPKFQRLALDDVEDGVANIGIGAESPVAVDIGAPILGDGVHRRLRGQISSARRGTVLETVTRIAGRVAWNAPVLRPVV